MPRVIASSSFRPRPAADVPAPAPSAPGGYCGRYLRVDLGTGAAEMIPIAADDLRRFIGGSGLGAFLLLREAPVGVEPLSPAAPIIFAFSPLVGTPLTTSAKFAVVVKSPLTGRFNDALSSSHFALAAKRAGFDALVLVGACARPSVLVVDGVRGRGHGADADSEPRVHIEPADDLWGLPAAEAETRLKARLAEPDRPSFHIASIGPAGENLVCFATLSHDGRHAGRGGVGAVFGAKNLKAIAARGDRAVPLADPRAVVAAARDLSARSFGPATEKYRELGTAANLLVFNRLGVLPSRNFQDSSFDGAAALAAENLAPARRQARRSCAACTIGCEHIYGVHAAPADGSGDATSPGVRVEYESLFALGPLCGLSDPDKVLAAIALCDEMGMDTISTGGTIAFALECFQRGLLPADAASPAFGDGDVVLDLIRAIGRREGLGDLLAEGSRRAAAVIGGEAPSMAPHVKGLEIPGYDPRTLHAMALGFAVGARGADHNRSSAYEVDFSPDSNRLAGNPDTARRAVETEDRAALLDSLILCKFLRGVFTDLYAEGAELLRVVTGWDVTADELRATARRIVLARRAFNQREGWTPEEDTLPDRLFGGTLTRERLRTMIVAYNEARGLGPEGWMTPELAAEVQR